MTGGRMTTNIEREIKLRFESADAAREAIAAVRATPLRERRLQDDTLFDWPDGRLARAHQLLRVRQELGTATLTFKGAPQSDTMKVREEIETTAGDPASLLAMLDRLGLRAWFRYQKYRQEYTRGDVVLAVDETPVGTFAELEGDEHGIIAVASEMGREQADYILDSYRGLFLKEREAQGLGMVDMVFEA